MRAAITTINSELSTRKLHTVGPLRLSRIYSNIKTPVAFGCYNRLNTPHQLSNSTSPSTVRYNLLNKPTATHNVAFDYTVYKKYI